MTGLDTSFLVAACVREHEAHVAAREMLRKEIAGHPSRWALAPQVLTEFAHIVTDPKRFETPVGMEAALDFCDQWWGSEEVRQITPDDEAVRTFAVWMRQHRLGRKRILDTFLAATYFTAGVTEIVTTDWRDFSGFGFKVRRMASR